MVPLADWDVYHLSDAPDPDSGLGVTVHEDPASYQ
jgi:hypothetical protein